MSNSSVQICEYLPGFPVLLQVVWIIIGLGPSHPLNTDASVFERDDVTTWQGLRLVSLAWFGCSQPFLFSRGNCFALNLKRSHG